MALNNQKITGGTPTVATDAATKGYVDQVAQGLDAKASVKAATTANITLAAAQSATDGLTVSPSVTNDRVLVKNQTPPANGIYVVPAVAWTRATDMDAWAEVPGPLSSSRRAPLKPIPAGYPPPTPAARIGTTAECHLDPVLRGGHYPAGAGLTLSGNAFDVGGTTNRITVAADAVDIAATYVGQTSITTVGTITAGTWTGTDIAVATVGPEPAPQPRLAPTSPCRVKYRRDARRTRRPGSKPNIVHRLNSTDVIADSKSSRPMSTWNCLGGRGREHDRGYRRYRIRGQSAVGQPLSADAQGVRYGARPCSLGVAECNTFLYRGCSISSRTAVSDVEVERGAVTLIGPSAGGGGGDHQQYVDAQAGGGGASYSELAQCGCEPTARRPPTRLAALQRDGDPAQYTELIALHRPQSAELRGNAPWLRRADASTASTAAATTPSR